MRVGIWRAADGWRWQLRARNGRIIGASSEAYRVRARCLENFTVVTAFGFTQRPPERGDFWRHLA